MSENVTLTVEVAQVNLALGDLQEGRLLRDGRLPHQARDQGVTDHQLNVLRAVHQARNEYGIATEIGARSTVATGPRVRLFDPNWRVSRHYTGTPLHHVLRKLTELGYLERHGKPYQYTLTDKGRKAL